MSKSSVVMPSAAAWLVPWKSQHSSALKDLYIIRIHAYTCTYIRCLNQIYNIKGIYVYIKRQIVLFYIEKGCDFPIGYVYMKRNKEASGIDLGLQGAEGAHLHAIRKVSREQLAVQLAAPKGCVALGLHPQALLEKMVPPLTGLKGLFLSPRHAPVLPEREAFTGHGQHTRTSVTSCSVEWSVVYPGA